MEILAAGGAASCGRIDIAATLRAVECRLFGLKDFRFLDAHIADRIAGWRGAAAFYAKRSKRGPGGPRYSRPGGRRYSFMFRKMMVLAPSYGSATLHRARFKALAPETDDD